MKQQILILYPIAGMFFLTLAIAVRMSFLRIKSVREGKVSLHYFKTMSDSTSIPEQVLCTSRNYNNLFELPVFFYAICIVFYISQSSDPLVLTLAWLFVLSRAAHSYIHVSSNNVLLRMRFFVLGFALVLALFIIWLYRSLSL